MQTRGSIFVIANVAAVVVTAANDAANVTTAATAVTAAS